MEAVEWGVTLELQVVRITFTADRAFTFPMPAANKLRGVIGNNLRERQDGLYEQFFDPAQAGGPSGLSDPPRPFVLRSSHLDGETIVRGSEFTFDLHVFDLRLPWAEILAERLLVTGFGRLLGVKMRRHRVALTPSTEQHRVSVRFLTPMELKVGGGLASEPDFGILAARARDRIGNLCMLYGSGPLPLDFAEFGERAKAVGMTRCAVRHVEAQRRSGSTGQTHSLGGFVGEAEYAGELTEFMPYLRAAEWTGVGRQTTWGKGAIAIQG